MKQTCTPSSAFRSFSGTWTTTTWRSPSRCRRRATFAPRPSRLPSSSSVRHFEGLQRQSRQLARHKLSVPSLSCGAPVTPSGLFHPIVRTFRAGSDRRCRLAPVPPRNDPEAAHRRGGSWDRRRDRQPLVGHHDRAVRPASGQRAPRHPSRSHSAPPNPTKKAPPVRWPKGKGPRVSLRGLFTHLRQESHVAITRGLEDVAGTFSIGSARRI